MTTTILSLRERAMAAAKEADAFVANERAADELKRLEQETEILRDRIKKSLGVTEGIETSTLIDGDEDFLIAVAVIEGLTFCVRNHVFDDQLCVIAECDRGCGKRLWVAIDDTEDLGRVLNAKNRHQYDCVPQQQKWTDADVAHLNATHSVDRIRDAGEMVAKALNRIAELEDQRALIKPLAIKRLMENGAATSATAAEKIVEQDGEYAAHRRAQRDAEVEKWFALANFESAKLTAQLDVAIASRFGGCA